jgi:predicted component of type VI protein secretion system
LNVPVKRLVFFIALAKTVPNCYNTSSFGVIGFTGALVMGVQLVVAAGNRAGQAIPVLTEKFIIGRAKDCHLKPTSELVSRYHCAILVSDEVIVRDLGSRNGVRLNGERIVTEQKLKHGDKLVIGPLEFCVHIDATLSAVPPMGDLHESWHPQSNDSGGMDTMLHPTIVQDFDSEQEEK